MGCPLASRRKRLEEFKTYPKLAKRWIHCGEEYLREHPDSTSAKRYANCYEMFYNNVFCDSAADFVRAKHDMFGENDIKQMVIDYFKIE